MPIKVLTPNHAFRPDPPVRAEDLSGDRSGGGPVNGVLLGAAHPSQYATPSPSRTQSSLLRPAATRYSGRLHIPFSILRAENLLRVPGTAARLRLRRRLRDHGVSCPPRRFWDFFAAGKGTLAPIDPPRFLVVRGLYRFSRNPMYNGVIALILGEAWLFGSIGLAEYALLVLIFFHLFVVLYEEPALESRLRGVVSGLPACRSRAGASRLGRLREHRSTA